MARETEQPTPALLRPRVDHEDEGDESDDDGDEERGLADRVPTLRFQ